MTQVALSTCDIIAPKLSLPGKCFALKVFQATVCIFHHNIQFLKVGVTVAKK